MTAGNLTSSGGATLAPSDDYAAALARRLGQPLPAAGAWGLLTTVLLGLASFGLLPLLIWPSRFREYVAAEARAIGELAEWARARGRRPAAVAPVLAAAEDIAFRPMPWLVCILLSLFVAGMMVMGLRQQPFTWANLFAATYYYRFNPASGSGTYYQRLHLIWTATLSVAYLVHWMQVRAHLTDVTRFVVRFNPIIESESLPMLTIPGRRLGVGLMWFVAAILMSVYHVWWGIPMLLAGAAQRRYMKATGNVLRRELTTRLCDISARRKMPQFIPQPLEGECGNSRCQAVLPADAQFCTRCGSPATGRQA